MSVSTDELRSRLQTQIHSTLQQGENRVIQSPTGSGKSHTIATTPWTKHPEITGDRPVLHLSLTKKARDDAVKKSQKAGVSHIVLEGREDACTVAKGDHDDELDEIEGTVVSKWIEEMCNLHHIQFSRVHSHLDNHYDGLPCCEENPCESITKLRKATGYDIEDSPEYDVIHATANFAYVPNLIEGANIIFDEQPQFTTNFGQETTRRVATEEIQKLDGSLRWEGLLEAVQRGDEEILDDYRSTLSSSPDQRLDWESDEIDTLASHIVRAVARATSVGEEVFVGWFGRVGIVLNEKNTLKNVYHLPDLSEARTVIGLDAHPSPHRWELETGLELTTESLLTPSESNYWRVQGRGLRTIQVGRDVRSLTTGWRRQTQRERASAIIHSIAEKHGSAFRTCVCAKNVKKDVQEMMKETGVQTPTILTYGQLRSRNTFTGESVGLVLGCIDPGDDNVLAMLGLLGLEAQPEQYVTWKGDTERKHGRGFVGPDSDVAEELLESVRAMGVAQGIGRYARDPTSDNSALVYVATTAVAPELIDGKAPGVKELSSDYKVEVLDFIRSSAGCITAKEVCEETTMSKPHALNILDGLVEKNLATVSEGSGAYGANEYKSQSGIWRPKVDLIPRSE